MATPHELPEAMLEYCARANAAGIFHNPSNPACQCAFCRQESLAQLVPIQTTGGPILSCSEDDDESDGDVAEFEPYELEVYDDEEILEDEDEE
jgi:hypothetical protein